MQINTAGLEQETNPQPTKDVAQRAPEARNQETHLSREEGRNAAHINNKKTPDNKGPQR